MKLLLPLAVLLLAACAQQPRFEAPRPARDAISTYTLEGRVSVRRGSDARQVALTWRHAPTRDEIDVRGPLGQLLARLTRDGGGARLVSAQGETVEAADWGGLAERALGIALPLDDMAHWVAGRVKSGAVARDAIGRVLSAEAEGWRIDYLRYESDDGAALPELMEMRRDDIEVRLKMDRWQLGEE